MFFDWVPLNIAPPAPQLQPQLQAPFVPQSQLQPHYDVHQTYKSLSHQRIDHVVTARPVSMRQGKQVLGSYDGRNAQPDNHYEHLDSCMPSIVFLLKYRAKSFKHITSEIGPFSWMGGYVFSP